MSSQIFKEPPPKNMLIDLLINYGINDNNKRYIIDYHSFKKIVYDEYHNVWLEELEPYYFERKKIYATREFTYVNFMTIIRQLCKFFGIRYEYEHDKCISHKFKKYYLYLNN